MMKHNKPLKDSVKQNVSTVVDRVFTKCQR